VWRGVPENVGRYDSLFGTVLRIDPRGSDGRGSSYGIPADNPFAPGRATGGFPEVWAIGFRNPHKLSWDQAGGALFVTDIGESNLEEVNLVIRGGHYGWPEREGTWVIDPRGDLSTPRAPSPDERLRYLEPFAQLDHDEVAAVSGGFVYRGATVAALQGRYVFGEIGSGRLFSIPADAAAFGRQQPVTELLLMREGVPVSLTDLVGASRVDLHFGIDDAGEIYLLTKSDGAIRRLASPQDRRQM
jgi:glucose/arabinose dehydrogenase